MVEAKIPPKKSASAIARLLEKSPFPKLRRDRQRPRTQRIVRLARGAGNFPHNPSISPLQRRQSYGFLRLFSLWLVVGLALGGSSAIAAKWLVRQKPPQSCQEFLPMAADSERLYCIQLAAESGEIEALAAAMKSVGRWESHHPLYGEGQRLLRQWSSIVLNLAKRKIDAGQLVDAMYLAGLIPVRSPLYPEAQVEIATWTQEWQRGKAIARQFNAALQQQNWPQATALSTQLSDFELGYWRSSQANLLALKLSREQKAAQKLKAAKQVARRKAPEALTQALQIVREVHPTTHLKVSAQRLQNQWSRELLQITAKRLESEDFVGAIATAKAIPHDDVLYPEAQDWIALSRASETAKQDNITALLDALEVVRQIDPNSPLFQQAKAKAERWQSQIQG